MSEFGLRKGLLMEKAPIKKLGDLILKSFLRKYRVQASFRAREGKMGGAVFVKTQAPSRIPLMISMSKAGAISLKAMGTMRAPTR